MASPSESGSMAPALQMGGAQILNMSQLVLLLLALLGISGCNASLPEPESAAAQFYQKRCSLCHRVYAPSVLTTEMWTFMVARMEQEMQRRGLPSLTTDERKFILDYLQKHSSNAAG